MNEIEKEKLRKELNETLDKIDKQQQTLHYLKQYLYRLIRKSITNRYIASQMIINVNNATSVDDIARLDIDLFMS